MLLFGLLVLGEAACQSDLLLYALQDNLNMSLTSLCSRNDLVANVSVLVAAGLCYWMLSRWPDIIVGTFIALLFLHSAYIVITQAQREMRERKLQPI